LDRQLLDPDTSASGTKPASLLNGISAIGGFTSSASGALSDFEDLIGAHVDAGSDLDRLLVVMSPSTALALSILQFTNGSYAFPILGSTGGTILNGIPVATSVNAVRTGSPTEKVVAAIDGGKVIVADDSEVQVSAARATMLQQDNSPTANSQSGAGTQGVSLYQTHSVGLKLTRFINFKLADSSGAAWMTSAF
jgi:hypothetical protein